MRRLRTGLLALGLLGLACKDPETVAAQQKLALAQAKVEEGKRLIAAGDDEGAIASLRVALSAAPDDPMPYLLMAQAQKEAGNDAAAVLAIKQAQELGQSTPAIKRQLADLYQRAGTPEDAIRVLIELRDANQLSDAEIRSLARLQAHQGHTDDAFKTLGWIQLKRPDDPEAKVVEAEVLLLSGKEDLATKLMDRLLEADSGLISARLLRARYFLNSGYAELAEADLAQARGTAAESPEVLELKARVLSALKRYPEAEAALKPLLAKDGRDVQVLAELAEVQLNLGKNEQAQALVDQALAIKPKFARALYVRGRIYESEGELKQAAESYEYALKSEPSFAPALSRIWRIQEHRGQKNEAIASLERLFFMNEATIEEKAALAGLYADSHLNDDRGRTLIDEALHRDPTNAEYQAIKAKFAQPVKHSSAPPGPMIIRGGRH